MPGTPPTSSCPSRAQLADLITGRLPRELHDAVEGHVRACEECQAGLAELDDADGSFVSMVRFHLAADPARSEPCDRGGFVRIELPRESLAPANQHICPHCGRNLTDSVGSPDRCPNCGRTLTRGQDATRTGPGAMPSTILVSSDQEPRVIDRYVLKRELGVGGFGTVYLAHDRQLDRMVAVKFPRAGVKGDSLSRFARESRNAAQLHHPNIVAVYDVGEHEGSPYLVCEYVEGRTLKEQVADQRPRLRESVRLVAEVAGALDYAHAHGVIHRDVKCSNIMIDRGGHARLMDFGLAKRDSIDDDLTRHGAILGTVPYMSPEQCSGAVARIDPRSDVYSLGVVLYELITGCLPFRGPTESVIQQIVQTAPQRPRLVDPSIDKDVETICMTAIAKRPVDRYQTGAAFSADLARWLAGEPIRATPPSLLKRFTLWTRRQPVIASLSIAVAALMLLMIIGSTAALVLQTWARRAVEDALHDRDHLLARQYAENGLRGVDLLEREAEQDVLRALPWLVESLAVEESSNDPARKEMARVRVGSAFRATPKLDFLVPAHEGAIEALVLSRDGNHLLTTSYDGTARVRDARTGLPISPALLHSPDVQCGDFHPDGSKVVTGTWEGTVPIWDVASGKPVREPLVVRRDVAEKVEPVLCVAYSPDGRLLAAGDLGGHVAVWDMPEGKRRADLVTIPGGTRSIAFSASGRHLLAAGTDPTACVLEVASWHIVSKYKGHRAPIDRVLLNSSGTTAVTASFADGTVQVWSAGAGEALYPPLKHGHGVLLAKLSPDEQFLATADRFEGTLRIWNFSTGKPVGEPIHHNSAIRDLAYSTSGAVLATGCYDGCVRLFDAQTLRCREPLLRHATEVNAVAFTKDDQGLLTATADGNLRRFELDLDRRPERIDHRVNGVTAAAFAPGAARLVTARHDESVVTDLSHPPRLARVTSIVEPNSSLHAVAFNASGDRFAAGGDDGKVRIWDATTGRLIAGPLTQAGTVGSIQFSPDGAQLLTQVESGPAFLWHIESGTMRVPTLAQGQRLRSAVFNPNGTRIATITQKRVDFWDASTGSTIGAPFTPQGLLGAVSAGAFVGDGSLFAAADRGDLRIWDFQNAREAATLHHGGIITTVETSPNGTYLVVGGDDRTARFWRQRDWTRATGSLRHSAKVTQARFSADERFLATASADGIVRVWDVSTGQLLACPRRPLDTQRTGVPVVHPEQCVNLFFTSGGNGLWVVQRNADVDYLNLKPVEDGLGSLRLQAAAYSGCEIDRAGGIAPLSRTRAQQAADGIRP